MAENDLEKNKYMRALRYITFFMELEKLAMKKGANLKDSRGIFK